MLGYSAIEIGAQAGHGGVDAIGQRVHTANDAETNYGDHQRVLNEILSILILERLCKHLSPNTESQECISHSTDP